MDDGELFHIRIFDGEKGVQMDVNSRWRYCHFLTFPHSLCGFMVKCCLAMVCKWFWWQFWRLLLLYITTLYRLIQGPVSVQSWKGWWVIYFCVRKYLLYVLSFFSEYFPNHLYTRCPNSCIILEICFFSLFQLEWLRIWVLKKEMAEKLSPTIFVDIWFSPPLTGNASKLENLIPRDAT